MTEREEQKAQELAHKLAAILVDAQHWNNAHVTKQVLPEIFVEPLAGALAACALESEKPILALIAEWREKAKNLKANIELCDRDEESKYQELAIQRETMAEELEQTLERAAGVK
jgi:hypothetical protein